ncbi:MAG: ribosomal RNA small subunit methyltransferase A [Candidatus Buchananbacteria bacterium RBG_13_39_9]|uniref:Ribosomal RNA small subunit methyltransferase A n=1 Tax=Candidatus Buchananbacteria bacterium RBG_13_39_9 TaxID=1797531 RepID=A0A1G1XQD9_9BACT|nr:MAG: ribosomal RNA small subunit methyltransferase A [Candidatus Buchananbacteria bacterium RBG_13_39_9]
MTINEIKKLCNDFGIRPSKGKGQNFLLNEQIIEEIIKAADLSTADYVLEIGPGFGILTEQLIKKCQKVLAIELDKGLVFFLKKKFSASGGKTEKNPEILLADILAIKNQDLSDKLKSVNYKIVANLPYAITKPIFKKFLSYSPKPLEMTLLVQKEVAQKIIAQPGEMSILALSVQFYGQPEIVGYVGKENFYPLPKVDSAILKIKIRPGLPEELKRVLSQKDLEKFEENKFWQLVKMGFSSPRKQLQNNLAAGLKISKIEAITGLKIRGLADNCRAGDLGLADWAKLYQQFMV